MKPDPEGILKGCKELGIHPAECVYVGDHINDLKAGINAGTKILACYFGYSLNQGSHARHIMGANQPRDLIKLIASL
jgi:phosphoglycolate phosphatase